MPSASAVYPSFNFALNPPSYSPVSPINTDKIYNPYKARVLSPPPSPRMSPSALSSPTQSTFNLGFFHNSPPTSSHGFSSTPTSPLFSPLDHHHHHHDRAHTQLGYQAANPYVTRSSAHSLTHGSTASVHRLVTCTRCGNCSSLGLVAS